MDINDFSVNIHDKRNKIREAFVIFSFKQMLTWFLGFLVVEYKLLEYPVREFPYAARNSFTFEYFIYPAICCVFNLKFPEGKGMIRKHSGICFSQAG
ncbi:CBO0543 family protein [Bacillus sp. 3255]|uniref:CBO0543 family protein n=1 Tax=Bacillus sp. 3255 TaxID=2817904 RepID=UPI00286CBF3B|nr:CBO0543 family protein [Bacillus sp. 3255]